jgi:hypothetical protein
MASSGGAIYAQMCASFSMEETSGLNCSSSFYNAFCLAAVLTSDSDIFTIGDSSVASCRGHGLTLQLCGAPPSNGSSLDVTALNSSSNSASSYGSGFCVYNVYHLYIQFSSFCKNGAHNCVMLHEGIENNNISCVALLDNSCESKADFAGLIYVASGATLSHCVIQSNSFDYFLGGPSSVTLFDCILDSDVFNTTSNVSYTM